MTRFFRRLFSAIVMWAIALYVIFSQNEVVFLLLIGSLGLAGLGEYLAMLRRANRPALPRLAWVLGVAYYVGLTACYHYHPSVSIDDFEGILGAVFFFAAFMWYVRKPADETIPLESVANTLFGLAYTVWLFGFLTKLVYFYPRDAERHTVGQFYVLYLVLVAKFSDMGAYLVGSRLGRHRMVPHISPAKTWEGFAGSLVFALFGSYLLVYLLPNDFARLGSVHPAILGIVIGLAAVVGDLSESLIKRNMNVKDSGSALPGIGGILDLIDSLLFAAPVLYFYLKFFVP